MKRLKLRHGILIALGFLAVLAAAGASILLETQAGLRWALHVAETHSGGALEVGSARGRLAGPFTLDELRINVSGARIEVQHVELDWHPSGLLAGEIRVARLESHGIRVHTLQTAPASSTASGPVLPRGLGLPLHIRIDKARLRDLDWAGNGRQVHLDRLDFALNADNEEVWLRDLDARGPRFGVSGKLRVGPRGRWPVHGDLSVQLRLQGYPQVSGRTRIDGVLRGTLELHQTLEQPFRADLRARLRDLLATPRATGTLQIAHLDPQALDASLPAMDTGADLAFAGGMGDFTLHGTLRDQRSRPARSVALDLAGGLHGTELAIKHLNLALAGSPARLTLRGSVQTRAPWATDGTLAWQQLQWPLAAKHPVAASASGGARIHGTLQDWNLELRTLLHARGVPAGRWALEAHGGRQRVEITALEGTWLEGRVTGSGRLGLQGKMPFRLALSARGLDLAKLSRAATGTAGFDAIAHGALRPLAGHMQLSRLTGQWRGHPLGGTAALAYAHQVLQLDSLQLAVGDNKVEASGRWGRTLQFDWRVDAPKLAQLEPQLQGKVTGKGRFAGSLAVPHLAADLQAADLHWGQLRLGQARLQADLDLGAREAGSLALHASDLASGTLEISRLDATLQGPADGQVFALALASNEGEFEFSGKGRLGPGGWQGQLVSGRLQPLKAEAFTLDSPAVLQVGAKTRSLARNCWHDAGHRGFCLAASSRPGSWRAELTLDSLPLALADAYVGKSVTLRGALDGTLRAGGGGRQPLELVGEVHAAGGSVTREVLGKPQQWAFGEAGLEARFDGKQAVARVGLVLPGGGMLDAALDVPWRAHTQPTGHLHLRAHLPDLSGFAALMPAVGAIGGRLDANLDVTGSLDQPRFGGYLRLSDLNLQLTRFGTRITRGAVDVAGTGSGLHVKGELHDAKDGHLSMAATLEHTAQWQLDARIQGKGFRAVHMPEAYAQVSPDMTVKMRGHMIMVGGSVTVPAAQVKPPHFSGAVSPSPDLVVVGRNGHRATPWKLNANLHIKLGDSVRFSGFGLSARMTGGLTLHNSPGKLPTGSGEIKILDGEYKAYGQDLTIEHGRVLFSGGPVANPGLDIRAVRTVGTVTAGLHVSGTLRSPRLQVFSDPPMSQSNALAYILFGHGMDQATNSQQSTASQAANALGIASGTFLAKTIGKQIGVDTVSVHNASPYETNAKQASLFLGKYLSPRLYVSYGIGIYEPINLLRIRYTLSRHWALEAESGTFSGADILFNIAH